MTGTGSGDKGSLLPPASYTLAVMAILAGLEVAMSHVQGLPGPWTAAGIALLSAFFAVGAAMAALASWARSFVGSTPLTEGLALAASAAAAVALFVRPLPYPMAELGLDLCLLIAAVFGGRLLARVVQDLRRVLAVCLVIAVVDAWSVGAPGGVTKELVESFERGESRALAMLIYSFPGPGGPGARIGIGLTDLVFASSFLVLLAWKGRPLWPSAAAMVVSCLAALAVGMVAAAPVPVLPFMAAAFVAVNWRALSLDRKEWVQVGAFLAILGVVLGAMSLLRG